MKKHKHKWELYQSGNYICKDCLKLKLEGKHVEKVEVMEDIAEMLNNLEDDLELDLTPTEGAYNPYSLLISLFAFYLPLLMFLPFSLLLLKLLNDM